ncbi:MAG: hypothetical protein ABSD73_10920 [Candidatus Bathyarchaeia archaeon]|jgi:hypothetical protein
MVTSWYPPSKATEVAKKYVEVMLKIPQEFFEKPLVQAACMSDKDGIVAISINKVAQGKYEEAFNLIVRRMVMFYEIEGFRFKLENLLTVEESMPLFGVVPLSTTEKALHDGKETMRKKG